MAPPTDPYIPSAPPADDEGPRESTGDTALSRRLQSWTQKARDLSKVLKGLTTLKVPKVLPSTPTKVSDQPTIPPPIRRSQKEGGVRFNTDVVTDRVETDSTIANPPSVIRTPARHKVPATPSLRKRTADEIMRLEAEESMDRPAQRSPVPFQFGVDQQKNTPPPPMTRSQKKNKVDLNAMPPPQKGKKKAIATKLPQPKGRQRKQPPVEMSIKKAQSAPKKKVDLAKRNTTHEKLSDKLSDNELST